MNNVVEGLYCPHCGLKMIKRDGLFLASDPPTITYICFNCDSTYAPIKSDNGERILKKIDI